jgi:myosin light chain 6
MADLKPPEVEKARLHFDIYDFEGESKVDCVNLGDLLRSLDLRPTQACVEKNGGILNPKKKGEKKMTFEEFLPIYSQVKKEKDVGAFEDFMEGLKVYDKSENGTMLAGELAHVMLSLGEKLNDPEVEEIMKTCAGQEDEDGFVKYEPFIRNVMAGPYPEEAK